MNPKLPAILLVICLLMSLVTLCMMAADKTFAKRRSRRIPERILFLFAALLGAPGGMIGMYIYRHKTKHTAFAVGFPLLAIVQVALLILAFLLL